MAAILLLSSIEILCPCCLFILKTWISSASPLTLLCFMAKQAFRRICFILFSFSNSSSAMLPHVLSVQPSPGQPASGDPAGAGRLDQRTSRDSFLPHPSVKQLFSDPAVTEVMLCDSNHCAVLTCFTSRASTAHLMDLKLVTSCTVLEGTSCQRCDHTLGATRRCM